MCPNDAPRHDPCAHDDALNPFDELNVAGRLRRMLTGLRCPHDSGEYKYARLQRQRLWAPVAATLAPLLALLLLLVLLGAYRIESEEAPATVRIERLSAPVDPAWEPEPVPLKPQERAPQDPRMPLLQVMSAASPSVPPLITPLPVQAGQPVRWVSPMTLGKLTDGDTGLIGDAVEAGHGNPASQTAVVRALYWLRDQQLADGSWPEQRTAMTGLALLVFLAHGEKAGSPEFGDTVERASRYLLAALQPDGRFVPRDSHDYTHPIATYALCEAYGAMPTPTLRRASQRALARIIQGQHPTGGWSYNLDPKPSPDGSFRDDTSYMGWCVQALIAGFATGLKVDGLEEAMARSADGFCANARADGGFGYTAPGRTGLTAVGVLCLQLLGEGERAEACRGLELLSEATPAWEDWERQPYSGGSPVYYWYYVTQALFKAGGRSWERWNGPFQRELVDHQVCIPGGASNAAGQPVDMGYWDSPSPKEHSDGRVQDTCLTALQLEVYYRGLFNYRRRERWLKPVAATARDIVVTVKMAERG